MSVYDPPLRLGYLYEPPLPERGAVYIRYLSRLLDSPPHLVAQPARLLPEGVGDELDLLVYWEPMRPWWQRWGWYGATSRLVNKVSASMLIARQPRWPLRRILLILRADETDEAAIHWLERLGPLSRAAVFVLPITPPIPLLYRHGGLPLQAEVMLATNTFSGAQVRRLISLCATWGNEGTLLLHNSEPERRIQWAIATSNCDLVIISDEPYHWLQRRFFGELLRPLLRWTNRSVLVAKS